MTMCFVVNYSDIYLVYTNVTVLSKYQLVAFTEIFALFMGFGAFFHQIFFFFVHY